MCTYTCKSLPNSSQVQGVNFIDTSPFYGEGASERALGLALKDIPREAYFLATKVGRYARTDTEKMFDFSRKKILESVEESMRLMGVQQVDLLQVHCKIRIKDIWTRGCILKHISASRRGVFCLPQTDRRGLTPSPRRTEAGREMQVCRVL